MPWLKLRLNPFSLRQKSLYEVTGLTREQLNREREAAAPWMPSSSALAAPSACPPETSSPSVIGGPGISRLSSFLSRPLPQQQPQNTQHSKPEVLGSCSTSCTMQAAEAPAECIQAGMQASTFPGASLPQVAGMAVSSPESARPAPSQPSGSASHRSGLPSYKMRLLGLQDMHTDGIPDVDEGGQGAPHASAFSGRLEHEGTSLDGRKRGTQPAGGCNSSASEPGENLQQPGPSSKAQPKGRLRQDGAPKPAVADFGADPGVEVSAMAMPTALEIPCPRGPVQTSTPTKNNRQHASKSYMSIKPRNYYCTGMCCHNNHSPLVKKFSGWPGVLLPTCLNAFN